MLYLISLTHLAFYHHTLLSKMCPYHIEKGNLVIERLQHLCSPSQASQLAHLSCGSGSWKCWTGRRLFFFFNTAITLYHSPYTNKYYILAARYAILLGMLVGSTFCPSYGRVPYSCSRQGYEAGISLVFRYHPRMRPECSPTISRHTLTATM